MNDAIIVSDIHLGSAVSQVGLLKQFLDDIEAGTIPTRRLVLNGDVFDCHDFRRLTKHHWKVLSRLRKMSDHCEIVWVAGNHDGPAEIISSLIGVEFCDELVLESGGRKVLVLHGHQFDRFIDRHPLITRLADQCYRLLQRIDPTFAVARRAKRSSKTFLRCADKIETGAKLRAEELGCDVVCCGHTHLDGSTEGPVKYRNSGCWTELPCSYLAVSDGQVTVHRYGGHETCTDDV